MKVPCCSICQIRYDENERVPLLLQCGHGFCKECLSKLFSSSPDISLSCPRCRHVSVVGNSVQALRKNFAVLALLNSTSCASAVDCDLTDEDKDEVTDASSTEENEELISRVRNDRCTEHAHGCYFSIDSALHPKLRLVRQIGEGPQPGQDVWEAVFTGKPTGSSLQGCRHRFAVKRLAMIKDLDFIKAQSMFEKMKQASMWCKNVCAFHGATWIDDRLCLVMDKYRGSVQSEMQRNEGRLTLEQILRYGADIALGVLELHASGVICMNLKPSNLLLNEHGHAFVSDYGLLDILKKPSCRNARSSFQDGSSRVHYCMDCTILSPHYAAPEAWEPLRKSMNLFWDGEVGISAESDAWSFGCTLVEMCTGSVPWAGLSAEEIYKAVVKARRLPPQYDRLVGAGIPRELWKMVGECLHFRPSRRPTFHAMLATFLQHLQLIPQSPYAMPDNDVSQCSVPDTVEPSPTSVLEFEQDELNILHKLIMEGDICGVRSFLAKNAENYARSALLEAQNSDGQSALHLACRRGSVELVEAILEFRETDPDILDKDGSPPIVYAMISGSIECIHALIKHSANVNFRLGEGFGPSIAHVCAIHGRPDCMKELILAGADANSVDGEGESVLHIATSRKHTECALILLENGGCRSMALLNSKQMTPLHICISSWNLTVVRRWLEVATKKEIAEAIEIPSPSGTALCMAAAIRKDHEIEARELVKLLLASGADPRAQEPQHGRTALHTAALANDIELVKIILGAGINVNITDVHNSIPLHIALARGTSSCVELLLSAGADCNFQDDDGSTALHIAADAAKMIRENLRWLIVMIQYPGAAVEIRNHSGKTLHDYLEALPREWISEDLMDELQKKGINLSPTIYKLGDWVKFKKSVKIPVHGWQGARHGSIGFVQSIEETDKLTISFCTGEAHVSTKEIVKVIPLDRGQHVRLKANVKEPRYGWRGQSRESIGTVLCVDDDGILRVGFPGASRGWKADPAEMERVEEFKIGDWVRIRPSLTSVKHGFGAVTPGSIGIVYCIRPDSSLLLELNYLPTKWQCEPEEVESVEPFQIGDLVCVKRSIAEPRYGWGGESHHSVGKIAEIESDGLVIIDIPNRPFPWQADPCDMEKVESFKVGDWVRVKSSVSSPKYGWEDVTRNCIGIIHSLEDDWDVGVAFCFRRKQFFCSVTDLENVTPFQIGQEIRVMPSVAQPRLGWSNAATPTSGKILRIDMDGSLNVKVTGRSSLWKVAPGDAERLPGFAMGNWVRLKTPSGTRSNYDLNGIGRGCIAVVFSVQEHGYLELAGCFRKGKWSVHYSDLEKVSPLKVGQPVRFRNGLSEPRWGWRGAKHNSRGVVIGVHADGELQVSFFGLPGLWKGDPADFEEEKMFMVGDWVELKMEWRSMGSGSIGIVQGVLHTEGGEWDGNILVSFCGEQEKWIGPSSLLEKSQPFATGQRVRVKKSVKQPRFGWSGHSHLSVGTISSVDGDGKLRMHTPEGSKTWMLDPAEVEKFVEEEINVGDWVRVKGSVGTPTYQWGDISRESIGVVHRVEDGDLHVAFCFVEKLWICKALEMEKVRAFRIGDKVKIRQGLAMPRWGWGMETLASKGEVVGVDANGKLRIMFKWREGKVWIGDPADIVLDDDLE